MLCVAEGYMHQLGALGNTGLQQQEKIQHVVICAAAQCLAMYRCIGRSKYQTECLPAAMNLSVQQGVQRCKRVLAHMFLKLLCGDVTWVAL